MYNMAPNAGSMTAPTVQSTYTPNASGQYSSSAATPPQNARIGAVQRAAQPAKKKPPKKKHGIPGLAQYLTGDSTFQNQRSQLLQQLENYRTQNSANQANVKQDYNTALNKMKVQRGDDLENIQGDYASRGLLNSGLYVDQNAKYDTKYQQQLGDFSTDQQRSLQDLLSSLQNYGLENKTALQNAKADAIRRRAQQYGIS